MNLRWVCLARRMHCISLFIQSVLQQIWPTVSSAEDLLHGLSQCESTDDRWQNPDWQMTAHLNHYYSFSSLRVALINSNRSKSKRLRVQGSRWNHQEACPHCIHRRPPWNTMFFVCTWQLCSSLYQKHAVQPGLSSAVLPPDWKITIRFCNSPLNVWH